MRSSVLALRRVAHTHWLLVSFLAVGLLLRASMTLAVPLPLMTFTDANVYVAAANQFIFRPNEGRTAGYPLVLRTLHDVWASPVLPIVVQHISVLVASVLLYAVARVAEVPRALAALAAGVWLVSIDWLWLEHQLLTETVGAVLVVGAVAAVALATARPERVWRVAIAAAVAAGFFGLGAAIVRPAFFLAFPGIGLAALLLLRAPVRVRVASTVLVALTSGALLFGYLKVQDDHTGFGMRLVGSELDLGAYPTVGPIARCDKFTPPPGTRSLCENTPPDRRPPGDWYYWSPDSPGRKLLAARPDMLPAIKLWSARAYAAHPTELRRLSLMAIERLFGVGGFRRPLGDQGTEIVSLDGADTSPAPVVINAVQAYYGIEDAPNPSAKFPYEVLEDLQQPTRPPGPLLLLALLTAVVGGILGAGPARRLAIVAGLTGWLPVLYATWAGAQFNWRYALVGMPLAALAAVAGGCALSTRLGRVRERQARKSVAAEQGAIAG